MIFKQPSDEQIYHHLSRDTQSGHESTAAQIAKFSGYHVSTVRKSLHRLARAGYVSWRLDRRRYVWRYQRLK